LKLHH